MTDRNITRRALVLQTAHYAVAAALLAGTTAGYASTSGGSYSVQTSANTGRGYNRGCAALYNVDVIGGGVGGHFINNAGGGGPCVPADFLSQQGATVTVSGTTDTTGRLTKAHDESSDVALPDSAYATAAADLKTGKVHLTSSAAGFAESSASARLMDTLHFTVAGATAATKTFIPVSFAFDGKMPGTSDPMHAAAELNYSFYFGNASTYEFGDYQAGYYGYYGNYPTFTYASPTPRTGGWVSSSFSSYTPLNTKFTGIYEIDGATATIPVDFFLGLRTSNVALDFSHTGSVSIGQVAGVSYTSDSGVFLTGHDSVGGVPEPASWAMLVAGFGVVGAAARRRRGVVVAA